MEHDLNLIELLEYIPAADLEYQDWINVGMALKHEGYTCSDWDAWSRNDSRYHAGECWRKWDSFQGAKTPVTGATIVQMAKERGWRPYGDVDAYALDWDSEISGRDGVVVTDTAWVEGVDFREPEDWNPIADITKYLETLFESTENVGYVTESWEKDGRYMPSKGSYDRTAGQLIEELAKYKDFSKVFGDYNPEVGAWIRFNPLDGKDVRNDNVTDYRYALVESDNMELEKQVAIIRELELPVAALVYSGGKSIHAIVRIEAVTYEEYRRRVDYLYAVLKKNGFQCDTQNKNPSRLSRMPGVTRKGHKQFLMDTNIGKASFQEWKEWIESVNDDLPELENVLSVWNNRPTLAPELIPGILRKGRKMMIVGASKSGKSMLLSELAVAIAEGSEWLGRCCSRGRVLYVNLEIPKDTFWNRLLDIYEAMGLRASDNLTVWNLRGYATQMSKLTPKLINRAKKLNPDVVVIDPIYKVLTGDENSAEQMALFCNEFDKLCTQLNASTIYVHHHSKGAQGDKRSMDRAAGSGVFARDADALLDLIQLKLPEAVQKQEQNKAVCHALVELLQKNVLEWQEIISQDDALSRSRMEEICRSRIGNQTKVRNVIAEAEQNSESFTALRVEGTLREFASFKPFNIWYRYPVHSLDESGILGDIQPNLQKNSGWNKSCNSGKKVDPWQEKMFKLESAFEWCDDGSGSVSVKSIAEYVHKSINTVKSWIDTHPGLERDKDGQVTRVSSVKK